MSSRIQATKARRLSWATVVAWMAVIFGLSSLPGSSIPSSGATPAHFGVYAVLGSLLYLALLHDLPDRRRAVAVAVLIASAYGMTDELHQAFVPGRTPDVVDWGVDTLGALAGAIATHLAAGKLVRATPAARPHR